MSENQVAGFAERVSGRLRATRDELSRDWLFRVIGKAGPAAHRSVPIQQLLQVLPSVIDNVARGLRRESMDPAGATDGLREVLEIQRLRGRTADEVLGDFRCLSDVLFDVLGDEARGAAAGDLGEVVQVAARLSDNLKHLDLAILHAFEEANRKELREVRGRVEEFVRNLAHELKNPLGSAEIAAELLLDEEVEHTAADQRRYAEMIIRNLQRGQSLIAQMRDRALPDLGFAQTEICSPLASVLDDVLQEVLPFAEEQKVRLEMDRVPEAIMVDAQNARLVLMNLVWNGVKYSDSEKPDRWVRVRVQRGDTGGMWTVRVEDNGLGIPAALQEQVFERFVRVHPDRANGTGLGLAIAREAAEEAGGGLWLESEVGTGSAFVVALPVQEKAR